MEITLSHCSILNLGRQPMVQVCFPGREHWSQLARSHGFVRSKSRIENSWRDANGTVPDSLPWRDYPNDVLTSRSSIHFSGGSGFELVISARNCCNEFGSLCRINGEWSGRDGDPPIPESWPVLLAQNGVAQLTSLADAQGSDGDIVTGLPLVMNGGDAIGRSFVLANASDAAHSFRVDPYGRFGPPSPAWQELCDTWATGKDNGLDDIELSRAIQNVADTYNAEVSDRLLHSILAECSDGSMMLVGVHGAIHRIARWLVEKWNVHQAILLDNSGSVGWAYREPGDHHERILLAGPNQRSQGTVFLVFDTGGHPGASQATESNQWSSQASG